MIISFSFIITPSISLTLYRTDFLTLSLVHTLSLSIFLIRTLSLPLFFTILGLRHIHLRRACTEHHGGYPCRKIQGDKILPESLMC